MSNIEAIYQHSLLSKASYAVGLVGIPLIDSASFIAAGFTQTQYDQFVGDGWEVISQSSDALYGGSGFSGTLFHNTTTNEYVFGNRGTAGAKDLYVGHRWRTLGKK